MSASTKKFVVGIFDDDDEVLNAVKEVKAEGVKVHEVYSPFPIHNLDKVIGHPRTRLPIAAFCFGATGTVCAILLTTLTMGVDWPMNIGGKDFLALPDFVPPTFELTVLLAAYGMSFTFFASNGLYPGKKAIQFDLRTTDDKFAMAIDMDKNSGKSEELIADLLRKSGAVEVNTKIVEL
jgi:hypothetical protein